MAFNDTFLRALKQQPVSHTPVWIMRQAGRYLPEYRETRAKAGDFLSLCKNPELAAEVTFQPLRRFDLDAAIVFSDILTIPDAMGLGLRFAEGEGPVFDRPVDSPAAIQALQAPDMASLDYVAQAIKLIKPQIQVPLIGFSGSPWTLACYMVEGGSSKDFKAIKKMLYCAPQALHQLLSLLSQSIKAYLTMQIQAGADAIMLFDTWGGILSTPHYQAFSLHYMAGIVRDIKAAFPETPIIMFTKNGGLWLKEMADTGVDALQVDWMTSLAYAYESVGDKVALQGNLDPQALYAPLPVLQQEIKNILSVYQGRPGHIFNLGHGIHPDMSTDAVKFLVDTVHAG